jgi:tetratricopeptide (TPR) repeat protein
VPALKALARLEQDARPEQARDYARRAWEAAPSDLEASALQGSWLFQDGRFAQAYTLLKPGAKTGRDPEVMARFANAAFNIGRIAEARETMEQIPAESPRHAEAQTFLALTADPGDDGLAAIEAAAEAALESDPTHAPALVVRAGRLERDGRTDTAIRLYEDLHRRLPDFHPVTIRLAALYADDPAKLDEAEALALEALEQAGSSPELDRVLGEILARKDKADSAITHLERARQAAPLDAEGLFFLGKSYHEAERPEEAGSTLQQALDAGLDATLATRANELLEAE